MGNTKLNSVIRQAAFLSPLRDDFWPIPDQYVGLEIELEGQDRKEVQAHRDRGYPFWAEHEDGSLRNGIEYVLNQAMMGTTLRDAVNYFYDNFTRFTASPRTSIHVHMNMRQDNETVEGLRNMVVLYYMYEDAFFQIADENRKWSSYCNAFEDNPPAILEAVVNQELGIRELQDVLHQSQRTNVNRYYGLNLNALAKYGTIEFRHFPLVDNRDRLVDWLKLLMELKLAANSMADAGMNVWDIFQTPDDVVKLLDYMPQFGTLLLGHVDAGRAFTRMVNVRSLAIARTSSRSKGIQTNPCFMAFLEAQKKMGKLSKGRVKKASKADLDPVALAMREMARNGVTIGGRRLTTPGLREVPPDRWPPPAFDPPDEATDQARTAAGPQLIEIDIAPQTRPVWGAHRTRLDPVGDWVETAAPHPQAGQDLNF